MKKLVTLDKMNKKAKKEYYASMRLTWNGMNPMTRTADNGKGYNRKKAKAEQVKMGRESGF